MCKKLMFLTVLALLVAIVGSANAIQHDPADSSLIVYYKFDNNGNDSSGNGYNGSMWYDPAYPQTDQIRYRMNYAWNTASLLWVTSDTASIPGGIGGTYDLITDIYDSNLPPTGSLRWGNSNVLGMGLDAGFEVPNDALVDWQNGQTGPPMAGTAACWVRPWGVRYGDPEAYQFIVGLEAGCGSATCGTAGGRHRFQMYLGGGSQWDLNLNVGLGDEHGLDTDIIALPELTWSHVALAILSDGGGNPENGTYKVYVDGAPMPPGTITTTPGYTPDLYKNLGTLLGGDPCDTDLSLEPMDVGNSGRANQSPLEITGRDQGFRGYIDEFGIYDRELTRLEIAALADADANQAAVPIPANNSSGVDPDTTLTWLAGIDVNDHEVYFGTNATPAAQGSQTATTFDPSPAGYLNLSQIYYWRIDEVNTGTVTGKLWNFTTNDGAPIYDYPEDGAKDQWAPNPDLELQWTGGAFSTSYDVYVSSTFEDVNIMDANYRRATATTDSSYRVLPPLSLGTLYYWRVNANHTTGVSPSSTNGPIQEFTTGPFYAVEDFEPYFIESGTPTPAVDDNWDKTGAMPIWSLISNDSATYPGVQSLDIGLYSDGSPYYSGIERIYSYNNDYTINNTAKALTVWYKADTNNDRIYAALNDTTNAANASVVTNLAPDTSGNWTEWNIALTDFSGVTLSTIRVVEVGEGDRANQTTPCGNGYLRVDDIRLYKPRYLTEIAGDADGDYLVNWEDVRLLAADWLTTPVNIIKNGTMIDGPDGSGWPTNWSYYDASALVSEWGTLTRDTTDGVLAPCALVSKDAPTSGWHDMDLTQVVDVTGIYGATLEISFDHKGDIEGLDNVMFEYRVTTAVSTALANGGPTYIKRTQRGGDPDCPTDCYGAFRWDWEAYSHAIEVTSSYLHLDFRLASRQDSSPDPLPWIRIDNVVVKTAGSSLPLGDINGNSDTNFGDHVTLAGDWLEQVLIFP